MPMGLHAVIQHIKFETRTLAPTTECSGCIDAPLP
jgi:hypothetical protein